MNNISIGSTTNSTRWCFQGDWGGGDWGGATALADSTPASSSSSTPLRLRQNAWNFFSCFTATVPPFFAACEHGNVVSRQLLARPRVSTTQVPAYLMQSLGLFLFLLAQLAFSLHLHRKLLDLLGQQQCRTKAVGIARARV